MKILYLCHRFPFPPKRGSKIRPFNMIHLAAQGHEVRVCSLVRSAEEATEGEGIAPHCHPEQFVLDLGNLGNREAIVAQVEGLCW